MNLSKSSNTTGGLARLWILRVQFLQGMTYNVKYGLPAVVVADKSFFRQAGFTIDTGGYTVQQNGNQYDVEINAQLPGNDDQLDQSLLVLEDAPFMVVALDNNGQYLLFGDVENYFVYNRNYDSGTDFVDISKYQFAARQSLLVAPQFIANPFE